MDKDQRKRNRAQAAIKPSAQRERERRRELRVDLASLLSIDHACRGCQEDERCCCSSYEVCVTAAEMNRIIPLLPEAATRCPHLETDAGFDNIFDEVEPGLFAIDTTENGLCLLAYTSRGRIRCSLHAAASAAGLPLEQVKPKACLLWPMSFSEGAETLSIADDALSFACTSGRRGRSRRLSPALVEAIKAVYGSDVGAALETEAAKGSGNATLIRRKPRGD